MIEQIRKCQKCGLCFNQKPLLEGKKECQIFWVGLSAKIIKNEDEIPLSPDTNTGMLIQKIEQMLGEVDTYKTNLVKCVPLNEQNKLRYPNKKEIDSCFGNLKKEIKELSPRIVFLLGEKVYSSVEKHSILNLISGMNLIIHIKNTKGFIMFLFIIHHTFMYIKEKK